MVKFFKKLYAKIMLKDEKLEKRLADINNEPYIRVVEVHMGENVREGYFELDWNAEFVASLYDAGYSGRTDEEVVEQWFNDLCRGVIASEQTAL